MEEAVGRESSKTVLRIISKLREAGYYINGWWRAENHAKGDAVRREDIQFLVKKLQVIVPKSEQHAKAMGKMVKALEDLHWNDAEDHYD